MLEAVPTQIQLGKSIAEREQVNSSDEEQAQIQLAAALIAIFRANDINPDPDVWQLISDKQLKQTLGAIAFGVLDRRRTSLIPWMQHVLAGC